MQERIERAAAALYCRNPEYETIGTSIDAMPAKVTVIVPWARASEWRRARVLDAVVDVLTAADADPA